jgi:hypothetical protein
MPNNVVTIDVQCKGSEVTVTVNPFRAQVLRNEEMVWQVDPNACVDEVEIDVVGSKWPFTDKLPYKSHKKLAKKAKARRKDWISHDTATYKISGTCNGPGGVKYPFVLDPEMIVE